MNLSTIAAGCLLLAIPASRLCSTESVEVRALTTSKSSRTVRITALLSRKAQSGVKVEIYRYESKQREEATPRVSLISDAQGIVAPPELAPGYYHVVASADKNLRADLWLEVSAQPKEKTSVFSMELLASAFPTRGQLLSEAEQMPIKNRMRGFHGVVYDPSGAVVPGVSIEVVRKGTDGKDRVAKLKSGNTGQFSAKLSNGSYIALFQMPGFQTQVVPFEVITDGPEDLTVTLPIGSTT